MNMNRIENYIEKSLEQVLWADVGFQYNQKYMAYCSVLMGSCSWKERLRPSRSDPDSRCPTYSSGITTAVDSKKKNANG